MRPVPSPALRSVKPTLSVVLVNYRRWEMTARLVRQLRRSRAARDGRAEIVVVDNHSPPHCLASYLRRLPGVRLRVAGRNRGFARAVNLGVGRSRGDWVLLLNPDMSVPDGFLDRVEELADRLDREAPRTGIVGLGVCDPAGSRQPSCGPFPTLLGTLARLLLPRRRRKYALTPPRAGQGVDWVSGCCLLVRRQVLDEVGGLDPSYFLYYEDVDLCRRARRAGWEVRYEPAPSAVHHHPLHARRLTPHFRLLTRHALLTYARRHWPRWQAWLLAGIVRVEAWARKRRARRRGNRHEARWMRRLGRVARAMQRDDPAEARRHLEQAVRDWEDLLRLSAGTPAPVEQETRTS